MALSGFDKDYYLAAKLAALKATETEWVGKDTAFLELVLTAHGLTAESHYTAYGYAEGLQPNAYFNEAEYKLAKATDMFAKGGYWSIEAAQTAFDAAWTGNAYTHYLAYGSAEGVNPSNAFDESSYLASKLAALQAATATATEWASKTVSDVQTAFTDAGLSVLGHYIAYGKAEAIAVTAVPVAEQVTVTEEAVVGEIFTLTTSTDTLTGTDDNDTFEGPYTAASGMTFQSSDSLDGGAGNDQLNVTVGVAGVHQASTLSNIESVRAYFTGAGTVSLLGATGVTSVNASGSTAAAAFSNLAVGTAIEVENTAENATFAYKASDVTGSADEATLTLSNVIVGSTVTVAAIETLNIVSGGGGNVLTALTAANATTINISGDQTLNLGAANTVATTINASTATAAITLISDNAAAPTVTGGSGNDVITFTGSNAAVETVDGGAGDDTITFTANLGATDVVDGGAGTDTLVSTSLLLSGLTVPVASALITNIETVQFSNEYANATTLANIQAGLTGVTLANATAGGTNITSGAIAITGEAGSLTVNLGSSLAGNTSDLVGLLTINDTGLATTDSLTINNKSINSTTGVNVDLSNSITSAGYETVTLNTGSGTGNVSQTLGTFTITPDATTADVSLTVTGNNAANFGTAISTSSTGLLTIDASGLKAQATGTASLTIANTIQGVGGTATITGTGGQDAITVGNFASTINGGAGVDTIVGGTAADNISGGAGNDTLTGSGGNDTIDGGDGNDTITALVAGNYTLTGGAGTDTFDLGGTLTQADSVDGGDGTDTLIVNNTSVTAVNALSVSNINTLNANLNNIEKLSFGTTLAQNVDLGRFDNISSIILNGLGGATVISGVAATNNFEIQATTGQTLGISLVDDTGSSDVVNINLNANALVNANTITAANVETINITGTDVTATNASDINVMTLVATKATTITVSGHDGLNLTNTGNTKVTTFDASGVVADNAAATDTAAQMAVTFTSANTSTVATVTITGGAGNDTLEGNASIDTISGGLGADTITVSAGNDVVDGGAGNDTLTSTIALFANNSATTATHTGGAGTDILNFSNNGTIVDADFARVSSFETITLANGANTVTLGVEADTTGIKTITGGTGKDVIDTSSIDFDNVLTVTTGAEADTYTSGAGAVIVKYTATTAAEMATESAAATGDNDWVTTATGDTINGFTSATDKFYFDATLLTNAIGTEVDTLKTIGAAGTIANTDRFVEITAVFDGTTGDAITDLNACTTAAVAIGDSFIAFMNDGTDGYLFLIEQVSAADTIAAQDITLIGQVDLVTDVATGDFVTY